MSHVSWNLMADLTVTKGHMSSIPQWNLTKISFTVYSQNCLNSAPEPPKEDLLIEQMSSVFNIFEPNWCIDCSCCGLCYCRFTLDRQIAWMALEWAGDWIWRLMQMTASAWNIAPNFQTKSALQCSHFGTPPCYRVTAVAEWKNNQTLESVQEFVGTGEVGGIDLCPLPFLSVSIFPFPPSCKSKIINHLPADKISCSVAKQLSHLVESCDEVQSKFLPLPNASGLICSIGNILPKVTRMQLKR